MTHACPMEGWKALSSGCVVHIQSGNGTNHTECCVPRPGRLHPGCPVFGTGELPWELCPLPLVPSTLTALPCQSR